MKNLKFVVIKPYKHATIKASWAIYFVMLSDDTYIDDKDSSIIHIAAVISNE